MLAMSDHLHALELRLSHERERLGQAKSPAESAMRKVWVAGIEKEIADEKAFLGLSESADDVAQMTDDELLAELAS